MNQEKMQPIGVLLDNNPFDQEWEDYKCLEWYDGPLLVRFRLPGNPQWYRAHWVDVDDVCNRWLVYGVTDSDHEALEVGEETLTIHELWRKSPTLHLVDLNNDLKQVRTATVTLDELIARVVVSNPGVYYRSDAPPETT